METASRSKYTIAMSVLSNSNELSLHGARRRSCLLECAPHTYAYSGDILDYIAVFNRKKVSLPFNPPPRSSNTRLRFFLFFISPSPFAFLAKSGPPNLYRSFQERILTYKTLSSEIEVCIPRNKRVSPFPPDGYKDLTISNSEGGMGAAVAKIVSERVHGEERMLVARYRNDGGRECSGRKSLLTAIRKK